LNIFPINSIIVPPDHRFQNYRSRVNPDENLAFSEQILGFRMLKKWPFPEGVWLLSVLALLGIAKSETLPLRTLWDRSLVESAAHESAVISGEILAADAVGSRLAMADGTGAVIIELQLSPDAWEQIVPGQWIELDFPPSRIVRRGFEIDCGSGPLVEIDGRHPPIERRGSLHLRKGKHPFQVEWFNGRATSVLQLGLDGPGFSHDFIPAAWLSQNDGKSPGLRYERFRVGEINSLDEIPRNGTGLDTGVVTQIDATPAGDLQDVALRFSGQLEVLEDGDYTFRLTCDDGARLKIGNTRATWKILPGRQLANNSSWQEIAGVITYAAVEGRHLRLELATDQKRSEITVLNPAGLDAWKLFGRRIKASGVVYEGGICVLAAGQLDFESPDAAPVRQLTHAVQVRELQPRDAAKLQPVLIQGIVTMSNHRSMVLQDDSGGIFVLAENPAPVPLPEPGERWIVEGRASPGDFSPIIKAERCRFQGTGALPPPRRPNREEILNGSLDAELVEIEGVVISQANDRIELLTRDGTVVIQSNEYYPLPTELLHHRPQELAGARLKLRGVFASSWNPKLGRLSPGVFLLGNASFSVVELAPREPAEIPLLTVPDLWKFTSKSTTLNRVRLRGKMLAHAGDTLLISNGNHRLRLASNSPQGAAPGDEVEVVGFARTGPISQLIVHPQIRVLAHGKLPEPIIPDTAKLPNLSLDGTLIRMEGRVISDTIQSGERRLELETGALRFLAAGPSGSADGGNFLRDSWVRVDGIYFATTADPLSIGPGDFEIRMTGDSSLQLLASPPWWTTRRLLLLVALLFGGLALVLAWVTGLRRLVKRRTSQLAEEIAKKEHAESERAIEQERARVARDLHDELGAGLTEIGLLGSLVANPGIAASAKSGYLGTLGDVSRTLVSALDEIVWAINPDYDAVDDLASYLWLHAQRLLKPAGIDCDTVEPVMIPGGRLGSRSRQSLLLAFKEALNNVIKHSRASRVVLSIRVERENLIVGIADDGIGLRAEAEPSPGSQGIAGMRERMHGLGGTCEILSPPDGGTVVNLTIPLKSP
jgi:signal transduction histidine kinase